MNQGIKSLLVSSFDVSIIIIYCNIHLVKHQLQVTSPELNLTQNF